MLGRRSSSSAWGRRGSFLDILCRPSLPCGGSSSRLYICFLWSGTWHTVVVWSFSCKSRKLEELLLVIWTNVHGKQIGLPTCMLLYNMKWEPSKLLLARMAQRAQLA